MNNKFLLIVIGIVLINFVSAVPLPHAFYGEIIYSNGETVNGEIITAKINENIVGRSEVIDGNYDLIAESEYTGLIYFYLSGESESIGNYLFKAFEITELNFIIEISETPSENETIQIQKQSGSHKIHFTQFCESNWKCSGWSACNNGLMTRACYDSNYCDYSYNKPIEETGCEIPSKVFVEENKLNYLFILFGAVITLVLIISLIVLLGKR
jgi:hypothetical protein